MFFPLKPFHFFLCVISPSLEFVVAPVHTSGHSTAILGLERTCGHVCLLERTLLRALLTRDLVKAVSDPVQRFLFCYLLKLSNTQMRYIKGG